MGEVEQSAEGIPNVLAADDHFPTWFRGYPSSNTYVVDDEKCLAAGAAKNKALVLVATPCVGEHPLDTRRNSEPDRISPPPKVSLGTDAPRGRSTLSRPDRYSMRL